jgi:1-acyl-sn-glycerol-3-phosphate acyltransferase
VIDFLHIGGRLFCIVALTLFCIPIQGLMLLVSRRAGERFQRRYWRGMRRIVGMQVTVIGSVPANRPVLFVSNHASWLDIIALGSVLPASFVAKGEIEGWPVINLIARLGRTVFVSRSKTGVGRERNDMLQRLQDGDNLILFPEGTTSDGCRILRFQSAFLAVTQGNAALFVQPVTLVYDRINGLPVRKRDRPVLSWYGAMDLASHFPGIARLRSIHATLVLDAAIPPAFYANRKILSAVLEERIGSNAGALRQGRKVAPLASPPLHGLVAP